MPLSVLRSREFSDAPRFQLWEANLSQANLLEANLNGADLIGANLSEAKLSRNYLSHLHLSEANLSRADLSYADLRWTDLSQAILSGTNLSEANLGRASLWRANLSEANLRGAFLCLASLRQANLSGANLSETDLSETDFSKANLSKANLDGANLRGANLSGADLSGANLNRTELIGTDISGANLTGSSIYGIAAWDVKLTSGTRQENLIITPPGQPVITLDNIKVAQFVYLLLNNEEIRDVIDTITSKAVLILGRFSDDRKPILNALRDALRNRGFLPIVFDFERPKGRDFTKSAPLELQATVPNYMIPFVPILQDGESAFSMFANLQTKYDWVLDSLAYDSSQSLIDVLDDAVINPALGKRHELELRKARNTPIRHVSDYRKHPTDGRVKSGS